MPSELVGSLVDGVPMGVAVTAPNERDVSEPCTLVALQDDLQHFLWMEAVL